MGIYDRPYYRDDRGAGWLSGRSMVVNLILVGALLLLVDIYKPMSEKIKRSYPSSYCVRLPKEFPISEERSGRPHGGLVICAIWLPRVPAGRRTQGT